jgi:hypothetical protein
MNKLLVVAVVGSLGCADVEDELELGEDEAEIGGSGVYVTTYGEHLAVVNVGGCTGTLISWDTVLTAGHCVCSGDTYPATGCTTRKTVRFTDVTPVSGTGTEVSIGATVQVYPYFNRGGWLTNDYALLKLDQRADTRVRYVTPVRVAWNLPLIGARHTLVGYGASGADCTLAGGTKRVGNATLASYYAYPDPNAGLTLVHDSNRSIVCPGDSGGPAFNSTGELVGVTSTRPGNHDPVSIPWLWIRENACRAAGSNGGICRTTPTGAVAYKDASYQGTSQTFGYGRWDASALATVGNNAISSVLPVSGVTVRLWSLAGCRGEPRAVVRGNGSTLGALDNQTSCLEVNPGVTLFSGPNYTGISQTLEAGAYNHTQLTVGNDEIESMIAAPGVSVTFCEHSGAPGTAGTGMCWSYSGAVSSFSGLANLASNVDVKLWQ